MARLDAVELKHFFTLETPTGSVNSSNTSFSIAQTPLENDAVLIFKNGLLQRPTTDYSLSGTTITFVTAPATGSDLVVYYIRARGE